MDFLVGKDASRFCLAYVAKEVHLREGLKKSRKKCDVLPNRGGGGGGHHEPNSIFEKKKVFSWTT